MGVTASSKQRLKMFALSAAAYWLIIAGASAAQDVSLPGGAASLNEAHGDWTVACVVRPDAQGTKVKQCAFVQEQFQLKDGQSQARQRVMRVELRPEKGGVKGFLVLPFGLDLASGVTYQLDEGKPGGVQQRNRHRAGSLPRRAAFPDMPAIWMPCRYRFRRENSGGAEVRQGTEGSSEGRWRTGHDASHLACRILKCL